MRGFRNGTTRRKQRRRSERRSVCDTLHAIEAGGNETAEIADLVSTAVLRRHLETMLRLGIEYDFLPRESEILHLKFWDLAFAQLKAKGVLYLETEGKNKGCWVMRRASTTAERLRKDAVDEDAKVIVRSNGTVTYVGKDIAYHLWKFGLLGRDFGYAPFFAYNDHMCWISTEVGEPDHPDFGGAQAIYNVIDSRQADPQANVIEALRGLGYTDAAEHYVHFSYEMVALDAALRPGAGLPDFRGGPGTSLHRGLRTQGFRGEGRCAAGQAHRRGERRGRQPASAAEQEERQAIAHQIAVGALRYFMLKFTRNTVIAFDFKEALSFEGETGPYVQYAVVRARNIFRKAGTTPEAALAEVNVGDYLEGEGATGLWELWIMASRLSLLLEQCIAAAEPAYLARHAFQLAQLVQQFLSPSSHPHRRGSRAQAISAGHRRGRRAGAGRSLDWLGIQCPEVM